VEDVRLANGQDTCQTQLRTNAWKDHLLNALVAPPDNQMIYTHVLPAQLDKFKIHNNQIFATNQHAMVSMIFN
jgi:hypothetical protein